MDLILHLLLPLLFLLAIKVDARKAVLMSPLAVLPDLDALVGLHRALGHSFVPVLVLPLAFLAYSYFKRPEWVSTALIAQFYLASHVILDLGGVAFLWPIVKDQFFLDIGITLTSDDGLHVGFEADWGTHELVEMETTYIVSDLGFALVFLLALMAVVFRKESVSALAKGWAFVRSLPGLVRR